MEFLLLLLTVLPPSALRSERYAEVDRIELNHYRDLDEEGPKLDQWIFWDWNVLEERYEVRSWRKSSDRFQLRFSHRDRRYILHWVEDNRGLLVVRSRCFCETWSPYDPELTQRSILPIERRRPLFIKPKNRP